MFRVGSRIVTLYAAQILIVTIAIGILASSAVLLDNPLLLEWHNAAAVFYDLIHAHIGLVLLTHQLGYFDILPLYVVLMAMAPAIVIIHRNFPSLLFPLSLGLYLTALVFRVPLPSWPTDGQWFFNPLAWQLIFVLGFLMARERGIGGYVRGNIWPIRCCPPHCHSLRHRRLLRVMARSDPHARAEAAVRAFQDICLAGARDPVSGPDCAVLGNLPLYPHVAPRLVEFLSMLGRNSLNVFCVGSLLSLAGQITRFVYRGDIVVDTVVVILGMSIMAFTAWLPEWREQVRAKSSAQPSPAS